MRKMKKMAALCMAGMMALSLAACPGGAMKRLQLRLRKLRQRLAA